MAAVTFARAIASGGGVGFCPVAPGTAGSLMALGIGAGLLHLGIWTLIAGIILVLAGGLWAVRAEIAAGDAGWVVIDEVAGQWIALLGLATPSLSGLLAAFLLFRLFDIAKPGPVGWLDRRHDAIGVMGDDVIAGGMAIVVLWAARALWPDLLS